MSDKTEGHGKKQIAVGSGVAGAVLAGLLAYMSNGNADISITRAEPHPAVIATLSAMDKRLAGVEKRLDDPTNRQELIAIQKEVSALNSRLDILLRLDTRRLRDEPSGTRNRR